jgi:hypothetical protein
MRVKTTVNTSSLAVTEVVNCYNKVLSLCQGDNGGSTSAETKVDLTIKAIDISPPLP